MVATLARLYLSVRNDVEVCRTLGFSKVWLGTWLYLILLLILDKKNVIFPNLIWIGKKSWFFNSEV